MPERQQHLVRARGRPRLGEFRLETILTQKVFEKLVQVEAETGVYRTRIAANVLSNWAALPEHQ
jgi:hypothetical protein